MPAHVSKHTILKSPPPPPPPHSVLKRTSRARKERDRRLNLDNLGRPDRERSPPGLLTAVHRDRTESAHKSHWSSSPLHSCAAPKSAFSEGPEPEPPGAAAAAAAAASSRLSRDPFGWWATV